MPEKKRVTFQQWMTRNRPILRAIYGCVIGSAVIFAAFRFGNSVLADGELTITEAVFVGGIAIAGFMAAMPWLFLPFCEKIVVAWQKRKDGGD